jgi:hypothetical protein
MRGARVVLALLAACSPADEVGSRPVVEAVDTPAVDTVDTVDTVDPVDTPAVDTPEPSCLAAPAELTCGEGEWPPFVPRSDGQEVTMRWGPAGGVWLFLSGLLRNTDPAVRLWHRVTDLRTGDVMSEGRIQSYLVPSQDGPWACEGYYTGMVAWLQVEGMNDRELASSLCGHEVLIEMASEDVYSSPDAPTVYAASSVRVILRPEPVWEITCD